MILDLVHTVNPVQIGYMFFARVICHPRRHVMRHSYYLQTTLLPGLMHIRTWVVVNDTLHSVPTTVLTLCSVSKWMRVKARIFIKHQLWLQVYDFVKISTDNSPSSACEGGSITWIHDRLKFCTGISWFINRSTLPQQSGPKSNILYQPDRSPENTVKNRVIPGSTNIREYPWKLRKYEGNT